MFCISFFTALELEVDLFVHVFFCSVDNTLLYYVLVLALELEFWDLSNVGLNHS